MLDCGLTSQIKGTGILKSTYAKLKQLDQFGDFEFLICTGYKSEIIEEYFKSWKNVKIINTGEETNTGGRVFKVSEYLDDNFLLTYGDGLANVNIDDLIYFKDKDCKYRFVRVR